MICMTFDIGQNANFEIITNFMAAKMLLTKVGRGVYFYMNIYWANSNASPSLHQKLEVSTPLEHSLNVKKCKK